MLYGGSRCGHRGGEDPRISEVDELCLEEKREGGWNFQTWTR